MWLHDNLILHQNGMFHVNGAKMKPTWKTGPVLDIKNPPYCGKSDSLKRWNFPLMPCIPWVWVWGAFHTFMISQQNAPFPQVINNQLPSKENTSKKLMSISTELKWIIIISISTVYCLHDFTAVCTLNPLLSPPGGASLFQALLRRGGLFERGAYLI